MPQALSADHFATRVSSTLAASWPSAGQLRGAHGKHIHLCLADHKPEVLEEPADLVLNIPLDLDEQSPADKKGFDRVTVEISSVADEVSAPGSPLSLRYNKRRFGRS